jgi:RNA polymerase sigma-70 factor (ECF subfamily)
VARVLAHDDRHAFAVLVRRHQSVVRHLLRRLTCGDAARADDLAQEAFLRAFRGLHTLQDGDQFKPWLCRIAYRAFLSHASKRQEQPLEDQGAVLAPDQCAAGRAALRHDLGRAMHHLAPTERAALALAYGNEATREEIAAVLDCPVATIKTHILRGKDKLRRALSAWADLEVS